MYFLYFLNNKISEMRFKKIYSKLKTFCFEH